MIPSALPLLAEGDYSAFQCMIWELLNTSYKEWGSEHQKAVEYRRSRNGSTKVPVSPEELIGWLQKHQIAPHPEVLWAFAEDKAAVS